MSDTQFPKKKQGNHDCNGSFAEGNNAQQAKVEGRVKRRAGLTKLLRDQTKNGLEVGERMLALARDREHPSHFKALEWVESRVLGQLPQKVQLSGPKGKPLSPLHGVDIAQLLELAKTPKEGG